MGIPELLAGPDDDERPSERSVYWCTACGMVFERSSPDIDYAWCTRCGADRVRELPWPMPA